MNHGARLWWFKNYWWVTFVAWLITSSMGMAVCLYLDQPEKAIGAFATLTVGALGVVYFFQKQMYDDMALFEKLSARFNDRYNLLSGGLQAIPKPDNTATLEEPSDELKVLLNNYFNLCAEEYLFYCEGRIPRSAWHAWCLGMLSHLQNPIVFRQWEAEVESLPQAYYGLSLATIESCGSHETSKHDLHEKVRELRSEYECSTKVLTSDRPPPLSVNASRVECPTFSADSAPPPTTSSA